LVVRDRDIGMVVLGLCELADPVHEVERLPEALEDERALERALVLAPAIRFGHDASIYETMTVSGEQARSSLRPPAGGKSRPARELVIDAFFGPLAGVLALALLPLRVPPPALVLANAAAGVAAALALHEGALVAAAVLLQLKTLLDNADGRLARASGRVTLVGRYLDTEADLAVNVVLFGALASQTGQLWLALAAFCVLTLVLSTGFNLAELYRAAHDEAAGSVPASGTALERALERVYRVLFGPHDRLLRALATRRLERILDGVADPERRRAATLAYHDRATMAVLANLGLSTQLAVLGLCLVLDRPEVYLWLVVGSVALLPVLQLRREWLARRALSEPRAA
jgi:archaetidylinositol phosphate synthase